MAKICPFVREKVTYLDCLDCGNRGYCEENPQKKHIRDYSGDKNASSKDDKKGGRDE